MSFNLVLGGSADSLKNQNQSIWGLQKINQNRKFNFKKVENVQELKRNRKNSEKKR